MNCKKLLTGVLVFLVTLVHAQNQSQDLITLNDRIFSVEDFKQVYFKNLELVQQQEQRSIDEYLDLFVQYKRKVEEARSQGLDKKQAYLKDFEKYQEQLSRNYVYEDNVTSKMVEQAYKRSKEELKTSHILIMCNWDALPQDTLVAYNKAENLRQKVLAEPEKFNDIAAAYSEEPEADQRKGSLDYFTVFTMVYPFENVAYGMEVGEISEPIRTQYGYHVIKLEDRRAVLPKRTVSHIMIATRFDSLNTAKDRILEIDALIEQGVPFEDLAKQYSDDKNTGVNGGLMRPFTKGDLKAPPFENAAFDLDEVGEISAPIQTRFGWHIIRLEDKGKMPTFEQEEDRLTKMVKLGDRAKIVTTAVTEKMKQELGSKEYPFRDDFLEILTNSIFQRKWKFIPFEGSKNKPLFTIGMKTYSFNDFGTYLEEKQGKVRPFQQFSTLLDMVWEQFEREKVKEYFKQNLEQVNLDYAAVINEYRDGLLIFDVMDKNIWRKAKNDSLGLQNYYESHKRQYMWKDRIKGAIIQTTDEASMDEALELLRRGKSPSAVKAQLNKNGAIRVVISEGIFEQGSSKLPPTYVLNTGLSDVFESPGQFSVIQADEFLPSGVKSYEEVQGSVLSDYQNQLEAIWNEELAAKYPAKINKRALKRLKRELKKK